MTLGLYKPSQGYWVRVMTATIVGVVTLAAAAWVSGQMGVLATKLPSHVYRMPVQALKGTPAPGQGVELLAAADRSKEPTKIGTAVVESYTATASELQFKDVRMTLPTDDPVKATAVRTVGTEAGGFTANIAKGMAAVPAIEPLYLEGGAASLVLLLGAILAYWICAVHAQSVDFLIATDMEMKKVNWSTQKDIRNSTFVVIGAAFLIAAALFATDVGFQWFFRLIGILVD